MMLKKKIMVLVLALGTVGPSSGILLTFENFAPPRGLISVNPGSPYTEAGFTLTPLNDASAVFDAGFSGFPGDNTSYFGFQGPENLITLTGPVPFSLEAALIGPMSYASGNIDFTVTGYVLGGGTVSVTFSNLATATWELIGFTDLQSATFSSTSDAGMDNLALGPTPEPTSLFLLGAGLVSVLGVRRWRSRNALT